jgi:dolichol-phosphate mannosyltransferase
MLPTERRFQRRDGVDPTRIVPPPAVEVSVVLPVLDEAQNVTEMCRRLKVVLAECATTYEIIFVAGGSKDGTEEQILRERSADPHVKLLSLSRNFGHQEAISAGLDFANGQAIIMMDGDLQHPPELIPQLLAKWKEGYQVVTTTRLSNADAGVVKRTASHWFYQVLNRLSGLKLKEGSADFRLLDRKALLGLRGMPERSRFLRGMVQWIGFHQIDVPYHAPRRSGGESKYSLRRQLRLATLATIAFSAVPLYLVAMLGALLAGASFLYGVYAIIVRLFFNVPIAGWSSVLALTAFVGGMQLMSIGIVGAYIAKIYEETKARPIYIVDGAFGFEKDDISAQSLPANPEPHAVADHG